MKKCIDCGEYRNCKNSFSSWIFFIIGILATIAVRAVTLLIDVNPIYAKVAWYTGIAGFFIFFVYKFRVSQARTRLIKSRNLVDKINRNENLTKNDYDLVGELLCSLSSKKEMINYLFIFLLSAAALVLAAYMDFLK